MKKMFLFFTFLFSFSFTYAQVITWEPLFPTENDSIIVTFHADKGTAGLKGYTGDVYAHTGVITNQSTSGSDWKYVKSGTWGNNTPETKLTRIGTDLYRFVIRPTVKTFYSVPASEKVKQVAFVFRSASSPYLEGKETGAKDIFLPIYEQGMNLTILSPSQFPLFVKLNDMVKVKAAATGAARLGIYMDGSLLSEVANDTIEHSITVNAYGKKRIKVVATAGDGAAKADSFYFVANSAVQVKAIPSGMADGINYNGNSATLVLHAPQKSFVYVIGDFNNWEADPAYYMNITPDGQRFWITVDGLTANTEYGFQYLVDGNLRIADPYTEKVLDPWNDKYIPASVYPNLKPYPAGKTENVVSILHPGKPEYTWQVKDFKRPAKEGLLVYELLVRDFLNVPNYKTLADTLGYLKRLGVNAIELMPINEFEGNLSWGYNPDFYFAPDKYYGTEENLRRFIDECHKNGIAVIIDMVLNHSFGLSPMVRLYQDANGGPNASNPWYNTTAKHDFNVGYDFNHESAATRAFSKRVMEYWIKEYNIDGYRFDLSKGFTQKNTLGNTSAWGQYDQTRVNIWDDYSKHIWSVDSTAYVILEHFADYSEEKVLADKGMMLWRNLNDAYGQSVMGYLEDASHSSNITGAYEKPLNWVAYMESHDEQWLMFKNKAYGRSYGSYDIKTLPVALDRMKLGAAFLYTIPGPKMMWQFQELGYDEELKSTGRTDQKPIHWEYYSVPERQKLYKFFQALFKLRNENEAFRSAQSAVSMRAGQGQYDRVINISHPTMNITIVGNFNVTPMAVVPNFQYGGTWYDYFGGDTLKVTSTLTPLQLAPGEFRIFTDKKLATPEGGLVTDVSEDEEMYLPSEYRLEQNYPNPFNPSTLISFSLPKAERVSLRVFDVLGREVKTILNNEVSAGTHRLYWNGDNQSGQTVSSGIYFYRLDAGKYSDTRKMILVR